MYIIAGAVDLHATFGVGEFHMVVIQVLLVPRVLLEPLVVFDVLEDDLTKTVKICNIGHLEVEQLGHQSTRRGLVVYLGQLVSPRGGGKQTGFRLPVSIA